MVTPFEVYLVLQLDSINAFLLGVGMPALIGGAVAAIAFAVNARNQYSWDKEPPADRLARYAEYAKSSRRFAYAGIAAVALSVIVPGTKTAAAMIIIPALTSKEVTEPLSREAGELFELAKEALRNAASKPEPKK